MVIYNVLNQLNINYEEVKHKSVCTVQEAINLGISKIITGIECKNLFVKSKNNYYLIFVKSSKRVNLKELSKLINETRFSFATIEELKEILNLDIGSVTPLGIINDKDNKVTLLLDKELKSEKVLMHPNINTRTLSLHYNDLLKFIEYTNHKYYIF